MATVERMRKIGRRQDRPATGAQGIRGLAAASLTGAVLTGTTLVLAGLATTAGATSSHPQTIRITTAKVPNVGTVLTTGTGLTLYRYSEDPAGNATCTGVCATIWPPLLASKGAHIAGPKGVKGLSLIKVSGGHYQVAFHHVALYRFQADKKKGQANGQGVESAWYAVLKSGIPAAPPVAPPTTSTTQAPTTTTAPQRQTPVTQAPPPTTTTTSPPTTTTGGAAF